MMSLPFVGRFATIGAGLLTAALLGVGQCQAQIVTQLATWDIGPADGGNVDFDPQLDNVASISGGWYHRAATSDLVYGQSTDAGTVTQGTGSLELNITGKGDGGSYDATINGAPFNLDTHFSAPVGATYAGSDPRAVALREAILSGSQPLYTIEFDIVYDVAQMRSIAWQAPEETVDPAGNGQFPQRFFWLGMLGDTSNGGFSWSEFSQNNINPFDSEWDGQDYAVFNASVPLTDFGFDFDPGADLNEIRLGFLYNSVFGTLPAASNTESVRIYIDNLRLVEEDILSQLDFNDNGTADLGDFEIFMSQHLADMPTLGDYDQDGDNDFFDYQQFESLYNEFSAASGGLSLAQSIQAVPEPGTLGLLLIGFLGAASRRARRLAPAVLAPCIAVSAAGVSEAQTTLIEGFEMVTAGEFDNWIEPTFAATGANPVIAPSATTGLTQGVNAMRVSQTATAVDEFSWNATTSTNLSAGSAAYEALAEAVNIGAQHYTVLLDVAFDELEMGDTTAVEVFLGLDFSGQLAATWTFDQGSVGLTDIEIPLSSFGLADAEDQGNDNISMQIGFNAPEDPGFADYSAYIDNIRLRKDTDPSLLTLTVNRADGTATLANNSTEAITWNYLTVASAAGGLDADGWVSLDDLDEGGALTWVEAGGSDSNEIAEGSLLSSYTLEPAESISLGTLANPLVGNEDLDFEIRRVGEIEAGVPFPSDRTYDMEVVYTGTSAAVDGDYNGDGSVDAADYTVWRDNLGAEFQLANEGGATPGTVTSEDYDLWASNYGTTAASSASTIPEPSTVVLVSLVGIGALVGSRKA